MKELISVSEAREEVLAVASQRARTWPTERVALSEAPGRTLAQDIHSVHDFPRFASSAMDGFATGAAASDARVYRIVGESRAGVPYVGHLQPGEAVRIATGAVIPDGTDRVVPVEMVADDEDGQVSFQSMPESGSHIRPPGKDLRQGERVLESGTRISASLIPMLAMLGVSPVPVRARPRVTVVTTGDELAQASAPDPLPPGMIRDSNGPGLAAMARTIGCTVENHLHAPDNPTSLSSLLREAFKSDIVLLSGGVSMGPHDHVRPSLVQEGVQLLFWRVRQRPGKPLAFGFSKGGPMVFGLPGNPASSAVCFDQYVRPACERLLQRAPESERTVPAVLKERIETKKGLYHFIRGDARHAEDGRLHVREAGAQDSNLVSSLMRANCLIHAPEEVDVIEAGEVVRVEWFRY